MVYDPLGGGNAHIDEVLTNISIGWPNGGMVGSQLFPEVRVRKQSDLFYVFGREAWMPTDDVRAPGSRTIEIPGLQVSLRPYFAREYALQIPITDEERENADSPLDPDRDATELVTSKILLRREMRIRDLVTDTARYATTHTTTIAAAGDKWDVYATSTPVADIKAARRVIHAGLFMEPNLAVIPYQVMSVLEDHPDFIERIKYSERGIVTPEIIAAVIGVQRVIVPGMGFDSSGNPGGAASTTYMWGDDVILAWVPARAGLRTPAFGYEFVWRYPGGQSMVTERWRSMARKSDLVRVSRRYDLQMIALDDDGLSIAGFLIKDVLT